MPSEFTAFGSTVLRWPTIEVYYKKHGLRGSCSPNLHQWLDVVNRPFPVLRAPLREFTQCGRSDASPKRRWNSYPFETSKMPKGNGYLCGVTYSRDIGAPFPS